MAGSAVMGAGIPFIGKAGSRSDGVRIGLIGAGSRGSGIAHVMKELRGMELLACCDILEDHLENGMSQAAKGAKAYKDYRRLLEDKRLDAVIIATPLNEHYQMAVDALDAGKHVYLEKTMTYDIPQALELVKKVKSTDRTLQIGHQYRYFAMYHKIKEMIGQGWLGEVLHYECQYHRNSDWRRPVPDPDLERQINWRMYREYSGGLMAELCSHQIDIVNWMTDSRPLKVTGFGGIDYWKDGRETNDNVRTIYEYPGGIKANVSSILSNAYKGFAIRMLGSKATIEVQQSKAFLYGESEVKETGVVDGVAGATLQSWRQGEPVPVEFEYPDGEKRDATAYSILDFAECVRTGKKPASNVETGRDVAIAVHLGNRAVDTETIQEWKSEYDV